MGFIEILVISIGLAMDAFAVSLGIGTSQRANGLRSFLRLSFHLAFFQGLMTLLGWLGGSYVQRYIEAFDHWVAFGLLAIVGIRMIFSGFNPENESYQQDPTKGKTLVILSVACSIDALAVGLSLAVLSVNIVLSALIISFVTFGFSVVGMFGGNQLGKKFGKRMEIIGGLVLVGIGLRILIIHLMGRG